jgi:hypothetical protein
MSCRTVGNTHRKVLRGDKLMKKAFVILSLYAVLAIVFWPGLGNATWIKAYGTAWDDSGGMWPTGSGGYYVWANSDNPEDPRNGYLLLSKLNANGVIQWTKKIYVSTHDQLLATEMENNYFFVGGMTKTGTAGQQDVVWAKFGVDPATGVFTPVFQKSFGGSRNELCNFTQLTGGGYLCTGTTNSYGDADDRDMLVIKIIANGSIDTGWAKVFHHGKQDSAPSMQEISGGYIMESSVQGASPGTSKILVAKLNSSGEPQWTNLYGGDGTNYASLHQISGGNYLLVGRTSVMNMSDFSIEQFMHILKLDGSGNVLWGKRYETTADVIYAGPLYENNDGTFILTGSLLDTASYTSTMFSMHLTADGSVDWAKRFSGGREDSGYFMMLDDGSFGLSGNTSSFSSATPPGLDLLYGRYTSSFTKQWLRVFGNGGFQTGAVLEALGKLYLTGVTDSFGAGGMDILGGLLNSDGSFPQCQYCKDVTLAATDVDVTVTALTWAAATTSLTKRTPGTASDVTVHVDAGTMMATDICTGPATAPVISVNPKNVGFGSLTTGTTSEQTVTIGNTGNENLVIGTITTPSSPFSKPTAKDNCSGKTVAPGGTCTLVYTFAPTTAGGAAGNSNVPSNDPSNPTVTVSLSGTGVAPAPSISVDPKTINFGSVTTGTTAKQTVTIDNKGDANLVINTITDPPSPFSRPSADDKCSGKTIQPGKNCTLAYAFTPSAAATSNGTSSVPSNDPATPSVTVSLSGTGVAPVCVYSFSPTGKTNVPYKGSTISVSVKAKGATVCPAPSAVPDVNWLTIATPISWSKNKGTVKIVVANNGTSGPRSGAVDISGTDYTVSQQATPCKLTALTPTSRTFTAAGGDGTFTVTLSPQDCSWVATESPDVNWLTITAGSGTGNGTVNYKVGVNTSGKNQTGKINVALAKDPSKKKSFSVKLSK